VTVSHDLRHLARGSHGGSIVGVPPPTMKGRTVMTTSTPPSIHPSTAPATHRVRPTRAHLRFAGHFAEMVIAMLVGMVALGPLWSFAAPALLDRGDVHALVMATNMTIGMALWMRIRRHSWRQIAEMSAAMYLPFVVLLIPHWLGVISAGTVMTAGHLLMLPAMFAAMLWRRNDYHH
jgi:hypothetical protein